MKIITFVALFALTAAAVCEAFECPHYNVSTFYDTSRNAAGLQHTIDTFRAELGGQDNGNSPGPLAHGHRSINWDAAIVPFNMPGDFFDKTVTRGAFFKARANKFAVSNPASPPLHDDRFSSLLPPAITRQFKRFSPERLFTPVLNNRVVTQFRVPASNRRASVAGYGAVFTDVDLPHKTFMSLYDKNGCLIARVFVPSKNRGLSFAGIIVRDAKDSSKNLAVVRRAVTKLGTGSVAEFAHHRHEGSGDVVVLDDLIYGEPQEEKHA